jgi:copper homeostasis protein
MRCMNRTLEVIVTDAADARAAVAGGADRLELIAAPHLGGMTPSRAVVASVQAESELPVRVMIRRTESHQLTAESVDSLCADVQSLSIATEFVCGAMSEDGMPDPALGRLIAAFAGRPWTFHRAVDDAPNLLAAVSAALQLPGCDQVLTAGDPAGVDAGLPRLLAALADQDLARGILVGGGVTTANLPELLAAGARGIHLGRVVRAGGTWTGPVQAELVRAAADLVHAH